MRISGGAAKGRKLGSPKGENIRPTSAKVREAVFNILQPVLHGARFLDLCAGTGAVGIEALSRGAESAVFVDSDRRSADLIRTNLAKLGLAASASVVVAAAGSYVKSFSGPPLDIIYFDPPYALEALEQVMALAGEGNLLSPGGVVILEHAKTRLLRDEFGLLRLRKRYRYGDTALSCYEMGEK